ncbi:glutathione reductase (NADPH) [Rhodoferax saidenbachensis]|uniref:Glutathione reductase (NADPH) n=1 Tax=Rhodoferax saidenbachensis TaxID=1484693 RepID=A0ABU1ZI41_9BURK|nr:glutathione reductase (NADPH) [Rhodoferax saidenbachensis]
MLKNRRDAEVARLEGIYRSNLQNAGVQILEGRATLEDRHTVALSDGRRFQAKHILIATGAQPARGPDVPGHELAIDSNGFFDLTALPARVVVKGAGYIALELACVLHLLGAQVTVVVRGDKILRGFDDELRQHLAAEMAQSGMQFRFGREVQAITRTDGALQVQLDNGDTLITDCVLRAMGRQPNAQGLGLEALGIVLDAQGAIPVDEFSQTTVPGIYAVGDVTNRVNLTPMAIREGHAFADSVFGGTPRRVDHTLIPTAVFTTPEAGVVGLTEEQALKSHPRLDVYRASFRPMKATLSGHPGKMLLKLLVDRDTDRVLGFHAVGPDTGEMAQLVGVALQLQATKAALDATLAVHPTAAEELVTMRTPAVRHNL